MNLLDDPEIQSLHPKILDPIGLKLLGCVYYGDPFHDAKEWTYKNEIGSLWSRFMGLYSKYRYLLDSINLDLDMGYEVHIEPTEYQKTKNYYVFVGIGVQNVSEIPLEMYFKPLPQIKYLQFTSKAMNHDKSEYIFRKWLIDPSSPYQQAYPYVIQAYNSKRYRSLEDPQSEIDWLVPIREVSNNEITTIDNNITKSEKKTKKDSRMNKKGSKSDE
jgi:AraC family transcriptional regulator